MNMTNSLKWIFNEYEFDNRVNNLAWTVAGKYDEDIHQKRIIAQKMHLCIMR